MEKIQVFEIALYPIYCPFCNQLVHGNLTDEEEDSVEDLEEGIEKEEKYEDWEIDVCEHTLFIASDHGFEYRSERFNQHMHIDSPKNDWYDDFYPEGSNFDEFTSNVSLTGAIKYASYGPFDSFGGYYGFAPLEAEVKE